MKKLPFKAMFVVLFVALVLVVAPAYAQKSNPPISPQGQEEKTRLLSEYQKVLENEIQHGQTGIDPDDGRTILIGESAEKMDMLWDETVKKIEEAIARPATERAPIMDMIRNFDGEQPIYVMRAGFPYNSSISTEKYKTSEYIYTIDIATSKILEVMPVDSTRFRNTNRKNTYSQGELEAIAQSYVQTLNSSVDIKNLQPAFDDKEDRYFFFRWEDASKNLPSGMKPFIQVSLSDQGELLNFVDTLAAATQEQIVLQQYGILPSSALASFQEVYANGSGYWSWINNGAYASQTNYAGYCYLAGWCSPTNFYWSYTDATASVPYIRGQWDVTPASQYIYLEAFIPSTNATAYARYYASYNNGANYQEATIDQAIYYNVWASVLGPHFNYGVVRLDNNDDISGYKVAWDEVILCTSSLCP